MNAGISKPRADLHNCSVCETRRLPVAFKMQCSRAYVLPVLLFGSRTSAGPLHRSMPTGWKWCTPTALRQILH